MAIGDVSPFWPSMQQSCVLSPSHQWTWHIYPQHWKARAPQVTEISTSSSLRGIPSLLCPVPASPEATATQACQSLFPNLALPSESRQKNPDHWQYYLKRREVPVSLKGGPTRRKENSRLIEGQEKGGFTLSFSHCWVQTIRASESMIPTKGFSGQEQLAFWLFSFYRERDPPLELQAISGHPFLHCCRKL